MPDLQELEPMSVQLLRRHGLLEPLAQKLVVAEAVAGTSVSDEERNQALEHFREQRGLGDDSDLAHFLSEAGISAEDLEWQLLLPLRIERHCQEHFRHKAEARFLERKNQLDQVVYSLLRVKDRFLARELYLRIAGGEANFADLAAEFAEGPERATKGIVGPVPLTQAHPALAEKLRTSSPGQLQEPMGIAEWWLVVRLERYTPASFDEATAQQMTNELFQEWARDEARLKLRQLPVVSRAATTA
jgi:parvulin-like peptidyl-prolyl isomerase